MRDSGFYWIVVDDQYFVWEVGYFLKEQNKWIIIGDFGPLTYTDDHLSRIGNKIQEPYQEYSL